jgi:HAD superfamily phosphoserine phosphatase-like hydrolase
MIVIFDFDETLTLRDSTRPLFFYLGRRFGKSNLAFIGAYLLYRLKALGEHGFKSFLIRHYLKGLSLEQVERATSEFLEHWGKENMNVDIEVKLREHLEAQDTVYVASANFDFLIREFCRTRNVNQYYATVLEVVDGKFTGAINGAIVKGKEKVRVLENALGHEPLRDSKLYCDSQDHELMKFVPNHVLVQ